MLVVLAVLAVVAPGGRGASQTTTTTNVLSASSQYCKLSGQLLQCDYKWTPSAVVDGDVVECDNATSKLVLQHIHDLTLFRSPCRDLTLTDVSRARLQGRSCPSCPGINIVLRNVTLDRLDSPARGVYAQESRVEQLLLETLRDPLTVIGSQVDVLGLTTVSGNGVSVKLHSSTIKHLTQLGVEAPAQVSVLNCRVERVATALRFGSTGNSFSQVRFTGATTNIVLQPGADVTLEDISGKVKVSSAGCQLLSTTSLSPAGALSSPRHNVSEQGAPVTMERCNLAPITVMVALSMILNAVLMVLLFFMLYVRRDACNKIHESQTNSDGSRQPFLNHYCQPPQQAHAESQVEVSTLVTDTVDQVSGTNSDKPWKPDYPILPHLSQDHRKLDFT